jgi:hypothetical protein
VIESPPVLISPQPTTVTAKNEVPVSVACPLGVTSCEGTITLLMGGSASGKQVVAARRNVVVGRSRRFKVAPGQVVKVPVRLSRRGARIFRVHGRGRTRARGKRVFKVTAVVALRTAAGTQTVTSTVTVRAARRQTRAAGGNKRLGRH